MQQQSMENAYLKGVNDTPETLHTLSEALVNSGILPYYLHQLDKVQGAAHFEVPEKTGLELIETLSAQISGYAVPRFVREVPHAKCKTALHPNDNI